MIELTITIFSGILLMVMVALPEQWLRKAIRRRVCHYLSHGFFILIIGIQSIHFFHPSLSNALVDLFHSLWMFAEGMLQFDEYSRSMNLLASLITYLCWLLTRTARVPRTWVNESSDFSALFFFTLAGSIIVNLSENLMLWFIGLEIISLNLYIFAASNKENSLAVEAGYKYFIAGSVATAFILLGIALLFRSTLSFHFFSFDSESFPVKDFNYFRVGILFICFGLFQKIAMVPLHLWSVDLYKGTPIYITGYMVILGKLYYFGGFYRLLDGLKIYLFEWETFFIGMAVLTMLIGSVMAWRQKDFKRLIAYSSITYSGFFLLAVWFPEAQYTANITFILAAYSIANIGIFAGLSPYLQRIDGQGIDLAIQNLTGLARNKKNRPMIFCITVMFLSLAGIPPLAGFFSKFLLFSLLIAQRHYLLIIILFISSLIAVSTYLNLILTFYQSAPKQSAQSSGSSPELTKLSLDLNKTHKSIVWLSFVGVLFLFIFLLDF